MSEALPTGDPLKKRKRAPKPATSTPTAEAKPKPKPKQARTTLPDPRAWYCIDHPVLYGGRPGAVMFARTEEEARAQLIEQLEKRGIKEKRELHLESLEDGEVFMFQ